jgi:hypothetical protein
VAGTQSIEFPTDVVQKSELEWTSYTPTWTTGTVGNGTLVGRYLQAGSLCHFSVRLTFGSTTTSSSTGWTFSLPVTSAGDAAASAFILNSGVTNYTGVAKITAAATNFNIVTHASAFAIGYTEPFTWGTGDYLIVSGTYEI